MLASQKMITLRVGRRWVRTCTPVRHTPWRGAVTFRRSPPCLLVRGRLATGVPNAARTKVALAWLPNLVRGLRAQVGEEIAPHAVCPAASGNGRGLDCQGDETYQ